MGWYTRSQKNDLVFLSPSLVKHLASQPESGMGYTFEGPVDDKALLVRDRDLPGVTFKHNHIPGLYVG